MKRSLISLAIIFCLVIAVCAPGSARATDNWVSVRSKNFLLIGNATEKEIGRVAIRLERFREVFSRLFARAGLAAAVPTTVVVFKNEQSFAPFSTGVNTAGYFQSGPDVNYITLMGRGEQDPFRVIFHEYTHLLISNTIKNVPTWLSEGLAEYYSTATVNDDQKFVLGRPISSHVYLLREKGLLPLKTLFAVDHDSPYYNEKDKQSLFYAQSWALTHYLILGKGAQRGNQIEKFIDALKANVDVELAFKQAFEVNLEQMDRELREYIRKGRYPVISGYSQAESEFDQGLVVAPLTEADAQAHLGDLLLHTNRSNAENYLRKALELDPNLAMAHASLGMLRAREGKLAEALKSLERAVATGSSNYLIHYYYAFALSREGADSASGVSPEEANRMRAHLNKAIELRPDFLESYGLLAYVNLISHSNLDESEQVLQRILTTSPERGDLAFMLAQIYMAKDNYGSAREILQKLSENQSDAELLRRCQNLLAGLERLQSYRGSRASLDGAPNGNALSSEGDPSLYVDPASSLREALKKPEPGEAQIQGLLTRIECDSRGITFFVEVDNRVLRLTTDNFKQLRFKSFSSDSGREVICGPRTPENNVVVTYVPTVETRGKAIGIAKWIEFVPRDFKF